MKKLILLCSLSFCLSCQTDSKNEVLVLGMVHDKHLTEPSYSTDVLRAMIRAIDPDVILAEIPSDRFEDAMQSYEETGVVNDSRIAQFPEYVDVIIPLTQEMDFELIPTSAWTEEMAENRMATMRSIRDDPNREYDWQLYGMARFKSDSIKAASDREFDPYWINSPAYDRAANVALKIYNDLFNEELGAGGWDNINQAHYANITKELDARANQGKRILITYGAGHKGWFLNELKQRDDIQLISLHKAMGMSN
ncbi:MAG: hypothetical protein HRT61_17140 [Ekhidna sp.]|nr:hypothetical protein [Ekhidna sp.]